MIARGDSMRDHAVLVPHAHAAQTDEGGPLSNSGNLAMFTANAPASSCDIKFATDRRPGSSSK